MWGPSICVMGSPLAMTDRLDRESTRLIAVSQPFAGAWLSLLPVEVRARITSSEFLWAYQRRFGLYLSQPAPVFLQLEAVNDGLWTSVSANLPHFCNSSNVKL